MSGRIIFTVTNRNPDTIYNKLAARLGREPSPDELRVEVQRIIREGSK